MNKYKFTLTGFLALLLLVFACEPQMDEKPGIGLPPTDEQMDFTINPGETDFEFILTNTSSVPGIVSWDLGNGIKKSGDEAVGIYSLPGTYTVTMTLITKGGTGQISKTVSQTKTDYSIFTDPYFILLSGGMEAPEGKTWVLDSLAKGHLGVGPAGTIGLEWWSADPLAKSAVKELYDDFINFKIEGFIATYTNHGKSYVKDFRKDDPAYTNATLSDVDYVVDYEPPLGTWFIEKSGDKVYLTLGAPKPLFPCFDVGAVDGKYEIIKLEENLLELVTLGSNGQSWHYQLIPMGYVKPTITFTVNVTEGADNDVACSITDYSIPEGQSVTNVKWDFGDGSEAVTTGTRDDVVHHTFMRRGNYTVTATLNTSIGEITTTKTIILQNDNSAYVPFLLDMMVVYNNFSEVQSFPVAGQDCSVSIVDNPSMVYPNKSSKVAFYSKTNNEWANAYMTLNPGYRFDLRSQHIFKIMVYGKAGDEILLKLENTDRGGNAWQTGTYDLKYTIKESNKWEVAEYDFSGVGAGWDWTGDIYTSDIVTDSRFNNNFYNVIRIMCNPGNIEGTHTFYFDDLSGPHVEGIFK